MAGCRRDVIISLLALLAVALPCSAANGIRGLDPLYKSKYDALDGKFTCLDGSKTMPASHINDAFCDCLDGSDEPGMIVLEMHSMGSNDRHNALQPPN